MATTDRAKSDWIALLEQANSHKLEKIPAGYLSREELGKKFGRDQSTITRKLPLLIESGVLTVGYFKRLDRSGRLVEAPFYKLLEKRHIPRISRKSNK